MPEPHDNHDANLSGTVLKALDILEALAEAPRPLSAQAVAKACGISRPTAYRLLATLMSRGFVRTDAHYNYSLGTKLLSLGRVVLDGIDLPELARPYLHELCTLSNETANLSILDDSELLYIGREESLRTPQSPNFVQMRTNVGTRIMPHCSAMGKAIMAFLPTDALQIQLEFSTPLKAYTPHTIVNVDALRDELIAVRARGYAVDDREVDEGTRCVAAPVFDNSGNVTAAMSIAGPAYRLTLDQLDRFAPEVIRNARALSQQLGFSD